jgi:hypothetical protein
VKGKSIDHPPRRSVVSQAASSLVCAYTCQLGVAESERRTSILSKNTGTDKSTTLFRAYLVPDSYSIRAYYDLSVYAMDDSTWAIPHTLSAKLAHPDPNIVQLHKILLTHNHTFNALMAQRSITLSSHPKRLPPVDPMYHSRNRL